MLSANIKRELAVALDYGGNEGRTFTEKMGTREKYVFDISNVKTVEGVKRIDNYEELKRHSYDLIMCNQVFEHLGNPVEMLLNLKKLGNSDTVFYIEVPSENPFIRGDKFSILKNLPLLLNPVYSPVRLFRYWLRQRGGPFMPMKEHVNFFTEESMRILAESNGFSVIDIQENPIQHVLGRGITLSALLCIASP